MKAKSNSTVDEGEIAHFSAHAGQWWNTHGDFAPLHRINPLRVNYIREQAAKHFASAGPNPLASRSLLDIGCGGGLIAEPMARLGARVTAIDASEKNIAVAKAHAIQSALDIDYRCMAAEDLLATDARFDIVLALEIVEHVADVKAFIAASCGLLKPGGLIIYSTLNRTAKSFALAIVGAEYLLRMIPRGTHDWHKFLKPHELANPLRHHDVKVTDITGMIFDPLSWQWKLDARDIGVNYLMTGIKRA